MHVKGYEFPTVSTRLRRLIIVVALLALAGALAYVYKRRQTFEPIYSGRTVTQWIISPDFETNNAAVTLVVLQMGEKSVPALREMLHSGNKLSRLWFAKAPRWLYQRLPIGGYQFERKDRAMWALEKLGRTGRPATSELLDIVQDKTEHLNQRIKALRTLWSIEADQAKLLGVLETLTNDPVLGTYATGQVRTLTQSIHHMEEERKYADILKSIASTPSTVNKQLGVRPSTAISESNVLWTAASNKWPSGSIEGNRLSLTNYNLLGIK